LTITSSSENRNRNSNSNSKNISNININNTNNIRNIKSKISVHAALIFKGQASSLNQGIGLRKREAQPHYSIQYIEGYDLLCCHDEIYIP
jgi:hypothetical protein